MAFDGYYFSLVLVLLTKVLGNWAYMFWTVNKLQINIHNPIKQAFPMALDEKSSFSFSVKLHIE